MSNKKRRTELKKYLESLSDHELHEELDSLLQVPELKHLIASSVPLVYVTFSAYADDIPGNEVVEATFGPYIDVRLIRGGMEVTTCGLSPGDAGQTFVLASLANEGPAGWIVHDGMEDESPVYEWLSFHTSKPPDTD